MNIKEANLAGLRRKGRRTGEFLDTPARLLTARDDAAVGPRCQPERSANLVAKLSAKPPIVPPSIWTVVASPEWSGSSTGSKAVRSRWWIG